MSRADRVRTVRRNCGSQQTVVKTAATYPSTSILCPTVVPVPAGALSRRAFESYVALCRCRLACSHERIGSCSRSPSVTVTADVLPVAAARYML